MNIKVRTKKLSNGNSSIYLDFYEKGKRWYEFLNLYLVPEVDAVSKKQNQNAKDKAIATMAKRQLHIEKEPEIIEGRKDTSPIFMEWLGEYLLDIQNNSDYSKGYFKTTRTMVNIIKAYLKHSRRSNMVMSKIDKNMVKGYLDYVVNIYQNTKSSNNPKPLSPKTQLLHQTGFTTMLNYAVRKGIIKANPFYEIDKRDTIKKTKSVRDYLTVEELNALSTAKTDSQNTKQCFMFSSFTGLRHSDISKLTWGDIRRTDSGEAIYLPMMQKTKKFIVIPLNAKAKEWLPKRGEAKDSDLVFKVPVISNVDRALKHMAKNAGINKNISYHTSRHTFATMLLTAGADIYTVSKLLGHTNVKTTQIYGDIVMTKRADAVSRVDSVFG